jgi:hypothetical protein
MVNRCGGCGVSGLWKFKIDSACNYCEVQDFNYDLKPNFSDYGEVDSGSI